MSMRMLGIVCMFVILSGATRLPGQHWAATKPDTQEQVRAEVTESDTPEEAREFAEELMAEFRQAVRRQAEVKALSEVDRQAALQRNLRVSRKIVDSLSNAVTTRNHARVEALIGAMRAEGIEVSTIEADSFVVRFPRESWAGRKRVLSQPKEGLSASSDFCYSGWAEVDYYWTLISGCTYRHVTYYCWESNSILICLETQCGGSTGENCGQQIFLN